MKQFKVLGTGCANCNTTQKMIEAQAAAKGIAVEIEKVEEINEIMRYGVMSTPGVVVDGKVVHSGGIPSKEAIDSWLEGSADSGGCCSGGNMTKSSSKCCG